MVWAVRNGNVVRGAKAWFRSSPGGGKCGPWRETAGLGQALVAGSVVRGEKLWSWVKPWWREMWSRERNCGPGSSPRPPECGPGGETAAPGQARPRPSVVQGEKLRPQVKPGPAAAWFREQNCGPGSSLRPQVTPGPARAWSSHLKYKKESKTNI